MISDLLDSDRFSNYCIVSVSTNIKVAPLPEQLMFKAIFVGQVEYSVDVFVTDCIVQNNVADFGALFIVYINSLCNSRVHIDGTTIADNDAGQLQRGGGILIGLITFADFLASFPNPDKVFEIVDISRSLQYSSRRWRLILLSSTAEFVTSIICHKGHHHVHSECCNIGICIKNSSNPVHFS